MPELCMNIPNCCIEQGHKDMLELRMNAIARDSWTILTRGYPWMGSSLVDLVICLVDKNPRVG